MRHLDRQPALSEAAEQEQAVSPLSAYSEVKGMDEEEGEEEEEEDSEQEQREEVIEREAKARAKEGFTARAERDFVRSVEEYDRAIELVTSIGREPDWIWLYHRGSSMGNLKDSEAGGKTYKWNKVLEDGHRVCKLEPELPQGFRLVGIAHYRLSNFSKALQSFLSALEKCPETGKDREKLENFVKVCKGKMQSPNKGQVENVSGERPARLASSSTFARKNSNELAVDTEAPAQTTSLELSKKRKQWKSRSSQPGSQDKRRRRD